MDLLEPTHLVFYLILKYVMETLALDWPTLLVLHGLENFHGQVLSHEKQVEDVRPCLFVLGI